MSAAALTPDGPPVTIAPPKDSSGNPFIQTTAISTRGEIAVVSMNSAQTVIYLDTYRLDGSLQNETQVTQSAANFQVLQPGAFALDDGRIVVTWSSLWSGRWVGADARLYNPDGSLVHIFDIYAPQETSFLPAGYATVQGLNLQWSGSSSGHEYQHSYQSDGTSISETIPIPRQSLGANAVGANGSYLQIDGLTATYSDWTSVQKFPMPNSANSSAVASAAVVALAGGDYAVAWSDNFGHAYAALFDPNSGFSHVTTLRTDHGDSVGLAALPDGGYVASARVWGPERSTYVAQTFDAQGNAGSLVALAGNVAGVNGAGEVYTIGYDLHEEVVQTYSLSNPGPTVLSIAAPAPTPEGNTGSIDFVFTVTRSGDTTGATAADYYFSYGGTADSSADFFAPLSGTVYIEPGWTTASIHIAVKGDTVPEGDETFNITLGNVRNGSVDPSHATATATILNDDGGSSGGGTGGGGTSSSTLSITAPAPTNEGTDSAFTVTRSGDASASALVDYYLAYGGTADASDFAGPTAGTVSFGAGQTSATIHVAVAGDALVEGDETFVIALANGRGADIDSSHSSATATILDGAGSSSGGGGSGDSTSVSTADANYTAPAGVRDVTLTGFSSQTVHANNEGDTIHSNNNGNVLFGGTGDDTFYLGRNGDRATGGGGNDTYIFNDNPWSAYGHITDFNAGDRLDLTPTLQKAGYVSGDAVAEGYLKFDSDASGNARVWFDPAPTGGGDWWLVSTLDGVSASSLHASGGVITV